MPVANINKPKIGTCAHGMPLGACPICNGMAGGNSTTKRDTPRRPGEMTYNQCAAIGAMLRSQRAAKQRVEAAQQNYIQSLHQFQKTLENAQARIHDFTSMIERSMPRIISTPVNFVLNKLVGGVLNIVSNVYTALNSLFRNFLI